MSKGFAFVEMSSKDEAEAAIQALNETEMDGRTIKVAEARPRTERPERRSRY
jgi:RNA recognition motif-containing protein